MNEEESKLVETFAPVFVYPIFGEEETIFGYQGLEIDVSTLSPRPYRLDTRGRELTIAGSLQYRFASGSLSQYLKISYESKFPETSTVKADDPEQILYDFIPPSYSKSLEEFEKTVEKDSREFKPVGEKIGAYRMRRDKGKGKGKAVNGSLPTRSWERVEEGEGEEDDDEVVYEGYWSNWDTKGFKEFHRKAQIFALLYIEGAQYIDEEDGRWEFVTL